MEFDLGILVVCLLFAALHLQAHSRISRLEERIGE